MSGVGGHQWRVVTLSIAGLLGTDTASALNASKAITQYVHSTWGTSDGLPNSSVLKILQTSDGYLWVATQSGLARFDGVRFTVFDRSNTPALRDNFIADLVEDRGGNLWIATPHGGLTRFRDGLFDHNAVIGAQGALTLAASADGSLWVGGYGGLVQLHDGKLIRRYSVANGLAADPVASVAVDRGNTVWAGTANGLNRIDNGVVRTYTTKDGLPNNVVTDVNVDADNAMWLRTQNADISRKTPRAFALATYVGISGRAIRDMLKDRDGNLWVASSTEGLFRVQGQRISRFTSKDGLANNEVTSLLEDRDGNLWVGTNEGGLERFRDGLFTTYAKEEGLSDDHTHSVIEDDRGDVWVTTSAGLNRLRGNQIRVFTTADGLPSNDLFALGRDVDHNLWIGTRTGDVVRLLDGKFQTVATTRVGKPQFLTTAIVQDSAGTLWLGTRGGGLTRKDADGLHVLTTAHGLLTNALFALTEGLPGTLWVGTDGGLNSVTADRVLTHLAPDGPRDSLILALHFDARDTLWIGTMDRGLFRLEKGRFTRYSTHQGLPDDTVGDILEDADGNLWVGTHKGISRLSRADLEAVARGTRARLVPIVFNNADGLKSEDLNTGTQPNAWRGRDGRLWFPSAKGVVVIDPKRLSFDTRAPLSRIEALLADQQVVDMRAPVRLAAGTRRLTFQYTAPSLSNPARTQFRYRLDGFDADWVTGGPQRLAEYTNLPPGRYTFHVGTRMESGAWNVQEAIIGLVLLPHAYQTAWFKLLVALVACSALWSAYRLRVNWLHAKAAVLEERQRIARDIHDSIAQGLSAIIFHTQAALLSIAKAPQMTSTHLLSVQELAVSSLDDARYSVWDLSPPVLDHKNLVESIASMARQLTKGRVAELEIQSNGTQWELRPAANHHAVLITQEAISNAIRHGHATQISVTIEYFPDALRLSVSDNGVGFVPSADSLKTKRGYGIRNMRYRADRLGAELEFDRPANGGTTVSLWIRKLGPWRKLWYRLTGNTTKRVDA